MEKEQVRSGEVTVDKISEATRITKEEIKNIYIWGSRLYGCETSNSDYDVLVVYTGEIFIPQNDEIQLTSENPNGFISNSFQNEEEGNSVRIIHVIQKGLLNITLIHHEIFNKSLISNQVIWAFQCLFIQQSKPELAIKQQYHYDGIGNYYNIKNFNPSNINESNNNIIELQNLQIYIQRIPFTKSLLATTKHTYKRSKRLLLSVDNNNNDNKKLGLKNILHSLRFFQFGIQILQQNKIVDFTQGNKDWKEFYVDKNKCDFNNDFKNVDDWEVKVWRILKAKYNSLRNEFLQIKTGIQDQIKKDFNEYLILQRQHTDGEHQQQQQQQLFKTRMFLQRFGLKLFISEFSFRFRIKSLPKNKDSNKDSNSKEEDKESHELIELYPRKHHSPQHSEIVQECGSLVILYRIRTHSITNPNPNPNPNPNTEHYSFIAKSHNAFQIISPSSFSLKSITPNPSNLTPSTTTPSILITTTAIQKGILLVLYKFNSKWKLSIKIPTPYTNHQHQQQQQQHSMIKKQFWEIFNNLKLKFPFESTNPNNNEISNNNNNNNNSEYYLFLFNVKTNEIRLHGAGNSYSPYTYASCSLLFPSPSSPSSSSSSSPSSSSSILVPPIHTSVIHSTSINDSSIAAIIQQYTVYTHPLYSLGVILRIEVSNLNLNHNCSLEEIKFIKIPNKRRQVLKELSKKRFVFKDEWPLIEKLFLELFRFNLNLNSKFQENENEKKYNLKKISENSKKNEISNWKILIYEKLEEKFKSFCEILEKILNELEISRNNNNKDKKQFKIKMKEKTMNCEKMFFFIFHKRDEISQNHNNEISSNLNCNYGIRNYLSEINTNTFWGIWKNVVGEQLNLKFEI